MRIISVSKLKGDEILGKRVYDDGGRVLLNTGVKLTTFYIERLKKMGIHSVYIEDEVSKEVYVEENISEKTMQMSKQAVKEMVDKYSREGKSDNRGVLKSVNLIIDDVLSNRNVMVNISDIRASDNNIYSHSVNVCLLSTIIGTHLGYNMLKLKEAAIGALLHDIGKIKLKLDKKLIENLNDESELEKYIELMHPKAGYDFLKAQNQYSSYSKVAALMHHEKVDGSGYPMNLKGNEINEIARLVSISNVFDNMTSGTSKEEPRPVYEVIEYLVGMSGIFFDTEIVKEFAMHIAAYPTGSGVKLNTNEKCLVVRQNTAMPLRPIVKVVFDASGIAVSDTYEIDLLKELTVFITQVCEL